MLLGNVQAVALRANAPVEEQLTALRDYVLQLQKQLQFVLQNIGSDNLDQDVNTAIGGVEAIQKAMESTASKEALSASVKKLDEVKVSRNSIYNGLDQMAEGYVLDARQGASLRQMIYPVGAIYLSVSAIEPSLLFGGTWEKLEGRFLLGAGGGYEAGTTGGEASHTLTAEEMPEHSHRTGIQSATCAVAAGTANAQALADPSNGAESGTAGGGQAHNNMPPYVAVHMWKRTA